MHKKGLTFEMHHQRVDFARPGNTMELTSNVWNSMPRFGDVMAYKRSTTRGPNQGVRRSVSGACYPQQIKWLLANWLHAGSRVACRISKLKWKMGTKTGGKKMDEPSPSSPTKLPSAVETELLHYFIGALLHGRAACRPYKEGWGGEKLAQSHRAYVLVQARAVLLVHRL